MYEFIIWLRFLATCLVTNSHYTGIYPSDLIANGGLLGDVLFFCVSGFCLYSIKMNFKDWYIKRILRVYSPVWVGTFIILALGYYQLSEKSLIEWFIYPTQYHFVASIIVLYVPYYFVINDQKLRNNLLKIMLIIFGIMILVYLTLFDLSYYHIDNVREPFIRFLFFEAMLLGAYFRQVEAKYSYKTKYLVQTFFFFVVYFAAKIVFSKVSILSDFQIITQICIFLLLFSIFRLFASLDSVFKSIPYNMRKVVTAISNITLEIYIVQYVIIELFRTIALFPLNWIIVTTLILIFANILNRITNCLYKRFHFFLLQLSGYI